MARDDAKEDQACNDKTIGLVSLDSTVCWFDDNVLHRLIFVVQSKNQTAILVERGQSLRKQVLAKNLAVSMTEIHMGEDRAFRHTRPPKDRQQKIPQFEPINIGKIKKAFGTNTW